MKTAQLKKAGYVGLKKLAEKGGVDRILVMAWADEGLLPFKRADSRYRRFEEKRCLPIIRTLKKFREERKRLEKKSLKYRQKIKKG